MNLDQDKPYRQYILQYMSFQNNTVFEKGYVFSNKELLTVKPESVARWLRVLAFGKDIVGPTDRARRRASTIAMAKKAVSFYMPNRAMEHGTTIWESNKKQRG